MSKMSSRKKKNIDGFSADYRSAYGQPAEQAEDVKNTGKNDREEDDFLSEYSAFSDRRYVDGENANGEDADEELLTKWTDELEPEQTEMAETERPKSSRRHHRYGVAVGAMVLFLALVGVGFIATTIGRQIYAAATDDTKLRAYDTFLASVVMQDPKPFASPDKADEDFVLNASLWKTITANNGTNYTGYDDQGRIIVPLGDVVDACRDLFGPSCQLQPKTPAQETFFEYNSDANEFHVALYSSDSSFQPYTESVRQQGDSTVLRVGYVSPSDAWRTQTSSTISAPKPTKYMDYVLKTNPSTNKQYIYAINAVKES
jgi:hypothetical protein